MTLCALCGRDVMNHTETEGLVHLKKLSKVVNNIKFEMEAVR